MSDIADILPYISLAFLFIVGLGIGASTTVDDFKVSFAKPKAVSIGFLSQYLFMPVTSFILASAFQVRTEIAVGIVLIGCSPGGSTSNLFSYWSNGDVALSVTMSFLSTMAAFALMPFWIWVFVKKALKSDVKIDWATLIVSLLLIVFPTCIGLAIRKYNTQRKIAGKFIWKWVEILSSMLGVIFLTASVAGAIVSYQDFFQEAGYSIWITAVIMQPIGCSFGYIVSKLLGMSPKETRTISLETGIQNFSIALAVVQLSFAADEEAQKYALMFPACYGFLYLFWSAILVVFFKYYLAPRDYKGLDNDEEELSSSQKVEFPIALGNDEEEGEEATKKELESGP